MDSVTRLIPVLWEIIRRNNKCSVNVSTIENKLTVNILLGKRRKTFCDKDENLLLKQLQQYLVA
jgi:hypothetical protein